MTSRERWTIYPLLFLALGIGLRSRLDVGEVRNLNCLSLTVINPAGKPIARLGSTNQGLGVLEFYSSDGRILLSEAVTPEGAAIRMFGVDGKLQTVAQTSSEGGGVAILRPDGTGVSIDGQRFRFKLPEQAPAPKQNPPEPKAENESEKKAEN